MLSDYNCLVQICCASRSHISSWPVSLYLIYHHFSLPLIKYWWGEPLQCLLNQESLATGCHLGRDDGGLQGKLTQGVEEDKSWHARCLDYPHSRLVGCAHAVFSSFPMLRKWKLLLLRYIYFFNFIFFASWLPPKLVHS